VNAPDRFIGTAAEAGRAEAGPAAADRLAALLDRATARLANARDFGKATVRGPVLDVARRLMAVPGGLERLGERIAGLEAAGVFTGTDWAHPESLQPLLAANTVRLSDPPTAMLEILSELRLLAVANGEWFHPRISSEQAAHFLAQVLALNLNLLFGGGGEADRARPGDVDATVRRFYRHLADRIGYDDVLDRLIGEIWRILSQRPIMVDDVKSMVTQIAVSLFDRRFELKGPPRGADRLVSALYGPTAATREDPGLDVYAGRLAGMDPAVLAQEAGGFARAMHDTGLVSPYHAVFLRHVNDRHDDLVSQALGLSATGRDALLCYQLLVRALIDAAIHPETSQAVYGLALLLDRGTLYMPAVGPALWRQLGLRICPPVAETLRAAFGDAHPPRVFLLAGVLAVLGQPLGVGQGNNPTCQAARAISMWAHADPDYLLQMVAWAARDDEVVMHFEGERLSSRDLDPGLARRPILDVDAVSVVVSPHIDRIYIEMGRRCAARGGDPHEWINPELHGWWVGRGCRIALDVATGRMVDHPRFVLDFYAAYHPACNGNRPVIHPQPAGLAITDGVGRFIGWHAVAIHRLGLDPEGAMRVYFYNPNNDSGQTWGDGIVVSTEGQGERFGESSLPVDQFASRLYLFHYDPLDEGFPETVPAAEVARAVELAAASWARDR